MQQRDPLPDADIAVAQAAASLGGRQMAYIFPQVKYKGVEEETQIYISHGLIDWSTIKTADQAQYWLEKFG